MKKTLTITLAIAACALIGYNLIGSRTVIDEHEDDEHHHDDFLQFPSGQVKDYGIDMHVAAGGTLKYRVRAPAAIEIVSDKQAHIIPKVAGIAVTAHKNLGERVDAGELLATLESKEMAEAKSNYLTMLKKEKLASGAFARESSLYEKKLSSAQDFHTAENTREEALIDLELARQKLLTLGLDSAAIGNLPSESPDALRMYELRSPIAGKIISRQFTPGEYVNTDREVFVVADLSTVWAEINVFPQDRQHVRQGQVVTIVSNDGTSSKGTVSYLSPVIDKETRTSTALVSVDNADGQWLPGSFVQAEFITEEQPVDMLVPRESIQTIDGVDVIFVAADGGFIVQPVSIGRKDDTSCEIVSGLAPGAPYACKNTFLLKADLKKDEAEHMD